MHPGRPAIAECRTLGLQRLDELTALQAAPPKDFLERLAALPWVRFKEVIDHSLDARRAFSVPLLELVYMLEDVARRQRGPEILGYFTHVELSFSMRADASYAPLSRVISLSLGFPLLASQLEATCTWLESVLFGGTGTMSLDELARSQVPQAVVDELSALYHSDAGRVMVRGKSGLEHPIGNAFLRFVIAHEVAHLIDFAEGAARQESWRQTVWTDYDDALDYSLETRAIDRTRYLQFQRLMLEPRVADAWATELLADGLAFHTLSSLPPRSSVGRAREYAVLQAAVELLFYVFVIAYRADRGSASHPPPTLRSAVMRARRRKDAGATWSKFLSEHWGAGLVTSELLAAAMRRIGGKS